MLNVKNLIKKIVVGYFPPNNHWMTLGQYDDAYSYHHCAEIPKEDSYITNNMTSDEIIEKIKTLRTELKQWLKNNDFSNLLVNNLQYSIKTALNLTDVNKHLSEVVDFSKIDTNEKKTHRMTKKELAEWCAKGNGYYHHIECPNAMPCYIFNINEANDEVPNTIQIRAWYESEWHEPMIEE